MAFNRKHLQLSGEFNALQKGVLIKSFDEVAAGTVVPQTEPADLTDSTAGTPGTTLAAVVGTTYSTDVGAIRNWIASLNKAHNDLKAALVAAGVLE